MKGTGRMATLYSFILQGIKAVITQQFSQGYYTPLLTHQSAYLSGLSNNINHFSITMDLLYIQALQPETTHPAF